MMKSIPVKYYLLLITLGLYACTKVITVNLNDAAPQIVIEGIVTNAAGPYHVQISKTVNFDQSNTFPPVTGAVVKITDITFGQTDLLTETTPGIYSTHIIKGIPGHFYQLDVATSGQAYTAVSVMPQPVLLDSLSFDHLSAFKNLTISTNVNYQDPPVTVNYYTFAESVNSRKLKTVFALDDRLSDGKYVSRALRTDSAYINIGDTIQVQMNCVDKNVFDYFFTLASVASGNSFRSVTPTNPLSNISNNALGYFSANTTQVKKTIAK